MRQQLRMGMSGVRNLCVTYQGDKKASHFTVLGFTAANEEHVMCAVIFQPTPNVRNG